MISGYNVVEAFRRAHFLWSVNKGVTVSGSTRLCKPVSMRTVEDFTYSYSVITWGQP